MVSSQCTDLKVLKQIGKELYIHAHRDVMNCCIPVAESTDSKQLRSRTVNIR